MKTLENLSVFLVDDDPSFRVALTHQLIDNFKSPAAIRAFGSGEECLKHIETSPNIVILDYYLNGNNPNAMNGLEVLKEIKKRNPETKVIMLSSQDKIDIAVDTIRSGAYDYIVKNDKVLWHTKYVLRNAANAIHNTKNLQKSKFWTKITTALVLLLLAATAVIKIGFPDL
jgi:two-component system, OmpR family, response regulator